jgi:predicted secreted protein
MTITAALVLYAVTWFMTFFIVLPLKLKTQGDMNDVVPGTPRSAPHAENVGRKAWITTGVATVIWAVLAAIIISGMISVRDFDWRHVMPPPSGL